MGIPIWCLIAPMFVVSVRAGLHDVVAQSFYEEPQSSSPTPVPTQSQRPELIGMKELVLFLTPEQVETLQAAGAVVQPYPEYDHDFAELQDQFKQSVEQQNVQQYQTWTNPSEVQKGKAEVQNFYKLLNIQEINDDLSHTEATEGTTEKATTTPRYKYTKVRQQYKEKEYSTGYVPKKPSRTKISNQSNNADAYVRFLPHYEHEILQMVPYQALPLSPYQFAEMQVNTFIQANEEAQRNAYSQENTMAQQGVFTEENGMAPQNAFSVINAEAQQNAFDLANTRAQQSAFYATTVAPQPALNVAQTLQNAFIQASTEAYRNAFSPVNSVIQQNAYSQETAEAQQNAYAQKTAEAQRNAYVQANTRAQLNGFAQINSQPQQNTYSEQTTDSQRTYYQTKTLAQITAIPQVNTEAQRNEFSHENLQDKKNAHPQINGVTQHNANAVPKKTTDRVIPTEAQQNQLSRANTVTHSHSLSQINPVTQKPANIVAIQRAQQNELYQSANAVTQRNSFTPATPVPQKTANIVASQRAQQNEYSQTSTEPQNTANRVVKTEAKQNASSKVNTATLRNSFSKVAQQAANTVASIEAQRNAFYNTAPSQQTANTEANTEVQQNSFTQASVKSEQNAYIEASTKIEQPSHSRTNKDNQRNLYKPTRPSRVHVPKGTKKTQGLEKVTTPVTPKLTSKTYFISQGTKEFKETLSSIEGLPPLLPLTPITPLEGPLEKPVTPAPPAPTVQTPILHQDRLSLLLAPLYQHQTITDAISRQKEELLKNEFNIRTKLQKMKESPQYYDQREYAAELEKLTRNFGEQNALARIEASTASPTILFNQGQETTERQAQELVKSTEVPMPVRVPKPHEVKIPAPYPMPIEFIRPFRIPKPVVGKRPDEVVRNVYVKVDKPYTIPKFAPYTVKQKVPVMLPINPEEFTKIRHIWEH